MVKAVLHRQGRIATPGLRMPLAPASPAALRHAVDVLEASDALVSRA